MSEFPQLETNRFLLQQIVAADQAFIFEGLSHPDVISFYGVQYDSLEATSAQMDFYNDLWDQQTGCWWKIVDKTTGERVGACGFNGYDQVHEKVELGYWLLPQAWKQGIMPEVVPVIIAYAFEHWKLHRIEAVIETGNDSSSKLSGKLGFTYEGTLRDSEMKAGKRISLQMFSLLRDDWKK